MSNAPLFGWGKYARQTVPLSASHTERAVFGNQPVLSGLASLCSNVQTRRPNIAKPEMNVAPRPNSSNYLFTCGIVIQILAVCILNFWNRNWLASPLRLILIVRSVFCSVTSRCCVVLPRFAQMFKPAVGLAIFLSTDGFGHLRKPRQDQTTPAGYRIQHAPCGMRLEDSVLPSPEWQKMAISSFERNEGYYWSPLQVRSKVVCGLLGTRDV